MLPGFLVIEYVQRSGERSSGIPGPNERHIPKEVRKMAHHSSISLHKPHIGGNATWVFIALGIILLIALSLLSFQWFLVGFVIVAAVMCVFLFRWHNQHKLEFNDLSKLEEPTDETSKD
jgi:hypothetical protein